VLYVHHHSSSLADELPHHPGLERQPGNRAGKPPEGTRVTESSKRQPEVTMWAWIQQREDLNRYMELAMKDSEKTWKSNFVLSH